jgi:hypothetical protein
MKTHAEFMAEVKTADDAKAERERAGAARFKAMAEKHAMPEGVGIDGPSIASIATMLDAGILAPTSLACSACGFQLLWPRQVGSTSMRSVLCLVCGWTDLVPMASQVGAAWPEVANE